MAPYVGTPEIKARRLVLAVEYHGQIGNPGLVNHFGRSRAPQLSRAASSFASMRRNVSRREKSAPCSTLSVNIPGRLVIVGPAIFVGVGLFWLESPASNASHWDGPRPVSQSVSQARPYNERAADVARSRTEPGERDQRPVFTPHFAASSFASIRRNASRSDTSPLCSTLSLNIPRCRPSSSRDRSLS